MGLELKNVTKKFKTIEGERVIFENLNIHFPDYGLIAITGESGCGKSTLLQLIAGLDQDYEGKILFNQVKIEDIKDYRQLVISFVYQNYQLFDYLSVKDNCLFYCHLKGIKVVEKQLQELLEIFELNELVNQKVKNLSGGQRQRVALGRAIVKDQKVFLMDEPLSNLDAKLRVSMRNEISKLHRNLGSTTIYVTHDQVEAMTMADRIVIMKDGVIQQVGKPMDLYEHPVNKFVAGFIGSPQMNFYDVKIDGRNLIFKDGNKIELPEAIANRIAGYSEVIMGIRGEDIKFDTTNLDVYGSHQKAVIDNTEIMGNENNLYFDFGGSVTIARVSKYEVSQVGDEVEFTFMPHKMHFFDKETEQVIGAE